MKVPRRGVCMEYGARVADAGNGATRAKGVGRNLDA